MNIFFWLHDFAEIEEICEIFVFAFVDLIFYGLDLG